MSNEKMNIADPNTKLFNGTFDRRNSKTLRRISIKVNTGIIIPTILVLTAKPHAMPW